jgi:hypothetical protein
MEYSQAEILQTVAMTEMEHLDVRTVTLGLSLLDCSSDSIAMAQNAPATRSARSGDGSSQQSTRSATSLAFASPTSASRHTRLFDHRRRERRSG